MEEIKFTPIGKPYPTPKQLQDRYIRRLEQAVMALFTLCIGMAAAICILVAI